MKAKDYKSFMKVSAIRRQKIKDFYASGGVSLAVVASKFKISRGRAWQIIRDYKRA